MRPPPLMLACRQAEALAHVSSTLARDAVLRPSPGPSSPLPIQVRIVRIFNTYGPRMALDDGRVVSNFVAQASRPWPSRPAWACAMHAPVARVGGTDVRSIDSRVGVRCCRPTSCHILPWSPNQALTGQPITVYGDGQQTRSFQ